MSQRSHAPGGRGSIVLPEFRALLLTYHGLVGANVSEVGRTLGGVYGSTVDRWVKGKSWPTVPNQKSYLPKLRAAIAAFAAPPPVPTPGEVADPLLSRLQMAWPKLDDPLRECIARLVLMAEQHGTSPPAHKP